MPYTPFTTEARDSETTPTRRRKSGKHDPPHPREISIRPQLEHDDDSKHHDDDDDGVSTMMQFMGPDGDGDAAGESAEDQMASIRAALRAAQEQEDKVTEAKWRARHEQQQQQNSPKHSSYPRSAAEIMQQQTDDEQLQLQQNRTPLREILKAHENKVVLYNEGATELFLAIEECDWERAEAVLHDDPEQAQVWVVSTGTVGTTFDWSLWKRLPIHEAARRQVPASFLTKLIAVYPESVHQTTQFKELPLHLAVECGASPSCVNLLAVSHWRGCFATDQSGRTPFDIVHDAESILDPEEQEAVLAALTACQNAYTQLCREQQYELQTLQQQHERGLAAIRQQHDDDLAAEQSQQETLLQQIAQLKHQIHDQNQQLDHQDKTLQELYDNDGKWQAQVAELEHDRDTWQQDCCRQQSRAQELESVIAQKDEQAVALADQIVELQCCIQKLQGQHDREQSPKLAAVQRIVALAVREVADFSVAFDEHGDDLHELVTSMGLVEQQPQPALMTSSEEKSAATGSGSSGDDDEAFENDEETMRKASRAASDSLLLRR